MFRKDLIDLLLGNPMGVSQIARAVKEPPSRIEDDLQHLLRSLILVRVQAETNNPRPCTDTPHPGLVRSQPWQARFQGSHHPGHV